VAIAFKSSEVDNRGSTNAPTIDKPGDLADGDFLVVFIGCDGTAFLSAVPTGWTIGDANTSPSNDASVMVLYRFIRNATIALNEAEWVATMSGVSNGTLVARLTYTGVDPNSPMDVAIATADSAATATPSVAITPVSAGVMVVAAHVTDPASGTYTGTAGTGFTERIDTGVSSTSNIYVADKLLGAAAATTSQPTMSASDEWASIAVALREDVSGPGYSPVLDTFTRADGALGSDWADDTFGLGHPGLVIISNAAARNTTAQHRSWWDTSTMGPDVDVFAKATVIPADGGKMGLAYRVQSPDTASADGYELQITNAAGTFTWSLHSVTDGTFSAALGSVVQAIANNDWFGVVAAGSSHKVYHRSGTGAWSLILTVSDGTVTAAGRSGMFSQSNAVRLDNFGSGTLIFPTQVAINTTITATMEGVAQIVYPLPGEMVGTMAVAMAVEEGDPHEPSAVSFLVTITATMEGRITSVEPLGRRRRGPPQFVRGPLGGIVGPVTTIPRPGGRSTREVLARIRR
jgi:hypothetical protein